MNTRRLVIILTLGLLPLIFLICVGSYHLYTSGWGFYAWWPMMACLALAYFLGWRWTRLKHAKLLPDTGIPNPPTTWTERDRTAWRIVEARAASVKSITVDQIADAHRYADEAIALAQDIAKVYNPGATDPFSHLTLPEIVTCAELVARDLNDRVNKYIPGSHLLTVNDWKSAKRAVDWGKTALDVSWLARAVVNPINTGMQYLASKASGTILNRVQDNVLLWFHTALIHELGKYLIELNSGRLKVGAEKYRELIEERSSTTIQTPITIAVVGQVKAGKSSLINALLGEHRAATDALPATDGSTRYELRLSGFPPMALIDTAGYGESGPTEVEIRRAVEAVEAADLVLAVVHARTAAREADRIMLERVTQAFTKKPYLNFPPGLIALTHVDLLTPAMEWSPPYDWLNGSRLKEVRIRDAVATVRTEFGDRFAAVVPVCTAPEKIWNVQSELTELMAAAMDDSRGAALLKAFHREGQAGASMKTVDQVLNAGREALKILWQSVQRSASDRRR